MKITPKFQEGGFLNTLDAQLDKLGTWGRLAVEALEPTGITAWKPTEEAAEAFIKSGSLKDAGSLVLNALGAIPAVGVIGKIGRLGNLVTGEKLIKKSKYLFDPAFYKDLVNPEKTLPAMSWMAREPRAQEEAARILDNEILKVVEWCKSKNIKELPAKMEDKVTKLAEKKAIILNQNLDSFELIESLNAALK